MHELNTVVRHCVLQHARKILSMVSLWVTSCVAVFKVCVHICMWSFCRNLFSQMVSHHFLFTVASTLGMLVVDDNDATPLDGTSCSLLHAHRHQLTSHTVAYTEYGIVS